MLKTILENLPEIITMSVILLFKKLDSEPNKERDNKIEELEKDIQELKEKFAYLKGQLGK